MQGENVGAIYYEVSADTSKLVTADKTIDDSMKKIKASTDNTDASINKLTASKTKLAAAMEKATASATKQRDSFSNLTTVIGAYLSLRMLQSIASLSDAYQQNASRIKNATTSTAEYEMVQARLLETANGTYRALGEAQEVYLSVSDTLKALKYDTSEVLDITDSFSYALVRDAARADQATTAMDAYSKALQKGKIESDAWASIMAAMPSITDGIAAATGKNAQEIRKLGVTGKLSIEALNEGLLISRERNKELAEAMAVSTKDAVTQLTNAFTVFFGKVNEASGASKVFTDNVAEMANLLQDPATIQAGVNFASAIVSAMNTIIKGAKETVGMVRWMAENVAAALNGPAAGDSVRIGDRVAVEEKRLAGLKSDRTKMGKLPKFMQGDVAALDKHIGEVEKKLNEYKKMYSDAMTPTAPETTVTAPRIKAPRPRVNATAPNANDGKKAAAEAERLRKAEEARKKAAQDYLNQMSDRLDKSEEITNVEIVLRDITRESVKLRGAEVGKALELAQALDDRIAKEKEIEDALNRDNALLSTQRQLQSEILGYSMKLAGALLSSSARQEIEERMRLEETFAKRVQDLQDKRRSDLSKATDAEKARINKVYDDTLKIEMEYQAASLAEYEKFTEKKKELDGDWRAGALRGIAEYADAAGNMAAQAESAVTRAASSMEEALVKFAQTGKLSFKDFADSVIADIARMAAKSATSGIMNFLGNMVSAYFGAPSTSLGSGSSSSGVGGFGKPNYSLGNGSSGGLGLKLSGGRANGGPVAAGGMYQVNERGTPELLNVGGNQYLMMGKNSGSVTPMGGAAGGGSGGGGVQVNVYNSSDSEVSTSERQGDSGAIIDVIVKKAVDATANSIATGGVVGGTIASTFGLSRGANTQRFGR